MVVAVVEIVLMVVGVVEEVVSVDPVIAVSPDPVSASPSFSEPSSEEVAVVFSVTSVLDSPDLGVFTSSSRACSGCSLTRCSAGPSSRIITTGSHRVCRDSSGACYRCSRRSIFVTTVGFKGSLELSYEEA